MLRDEIQAALKDAIKNGRNKEVSTLRLITAALKDRDIAARSKGNQDGINDDEFLSMLQTMIKQRQESAKLYREGNREELAMSEEAEIETIRRFMPEQMDEAAISAAIAAALEETGAESIKDMGKVMGLLKQRHAGQMDFGVVSGMIKEKLLG
ncbi:MAG: GatB/YqeY domain-containing protein [Candidatus Puniceispirillales bacterium]